MLAPTFFVGRYSMTVGAAIGRPLQFLYCRQLFGGSKVTDAKGTETAYTFDNFGRYENITVDNGAGLTYNYSNGKLSQIQRKADGQTTLAYHFVYDAFGNTKEIKVGNKVLAEYVYGDSNGMLLSQSYGNEDSVSFTYDNLGRAKTTTYMDEDENIVRVLSYIYTGDGQLYSVHDSATGYTYIYTYDSLGRLIASRVEDSSGETLMRTQLGYNASNQITKQSWTVGDTTYQETYAYNTGDATLSSYQNALGQTVSLGYDFLRRLSTVTAGNIYTQTYTYRDIDDNKTTTQVSGLAYSGFTGAPSYGYTYDVLGNILTYTENGTAYAYTYDDLGQLLTATGGGKAWAYTYDLGGNILTATDGTTSHTYTYGDAEWADLLTAFDGQAITYDASGNPLSYYNGTRYTFTWAEGRRLTSAAVNGKTYTYTYDSDGLRLSKTVEGVTHNYFYASGKLLRETYGNITLDFLYSNTGYPYALIYTAGETTATYYYITNLQGDVLSLIDTNGATVASYQYDPYGKLLSVSGSLADSIGQINPLRYRGYYFDSETQLYYLQSRYYDPATCRFISADSFVFADQDILGNNTFAYCCNNPISRIDETGHWFDIFWDVVSLVVSVVEVVQNPTDVGAWVGLAMDAVDVLVPCVSGLGEATDAVNATRKTVDAVDDLHDAGKVADAAETVTQSTRSRVVREAWANEVELVRETGQGTRKWTQAEIDELLTTGKVKGYQGHHMKSVKGYPHLAGDPDNIQFLTRKEHLLAHGGNWRNITHGRYVE